MGRGSLDEIGARQPAEMGPAWSHARSEVQGLHGACAGRKADDIRAWSARSCQSMRRSGQRINSPVDSCKTSPSPHRPSASAGRAHSPPWSRRGTLAIARPSGVQSLAVTSTLLTDGLRQHAGGAPRDRRARQRDIGEFLVLERQLGALDLLVRARARQALGEMAPVRRRQADIAVMRAGRRDMRAGRDQLLAQRDDPRIARGRAGFDHQQRVAGLLPTSAPRARFVRPRRSRRSCSSPRRGRPPPPWRASARASPRS